ncbi:type VI secretion system Vgr family protein [Paraburkholderia bannensis]|uniref:type VI secretion system Vgr family protein n=1 Tax=Paraburkholderia bannensis TaxID=765414 RepID=UPI002AB615DC|nr:type VI secretion system tip protein TssI/VgrG [Paraburkholderia bannensis]
MREAWQMLGMRGPAFPERQTIGPGGYERTESLLVPRRIVGGESIGSLFEYRVEASLRASIAPMSFDIDARERIDLDRIAGSAIGLTIELERMGAASNGAGTRHINGIVSKAGVLGMDGNEIVYEFIVRPSFWLATLKADSRAFSGPIIDILHDVMNRYGLIEWRLSNRINPQRDYIRQAWETDWDFFMRLCEEWGFVVWFEHDEQMHTLVIADSTSACRKHARDYETLRYHTSGGHIDQEHIDALILCSTLTSGKVTVHDHSYKRPRLSPYATPMRETCDQPRKTQNADQEIYARADFAQPGTRRDAPYDEGQWRDEAQYLARVKLEALRGCGFRAEARGALRGVEAGKTLSVTHYSHEAGNREYLVIRSDLDISATGTLSSTQREHEIKASFVMQPVSEPYRMPQITVRPVLGAEYAVIVGPGNAEIFVDDLNRVLVQFDWDRDGKFDGKSCIWVRLATSWQGNGMGTVTHARCGQQVLIGYIHGDPDRPVAMSFVVDENNPPPWKLPANQSLTGIVSKSLGRGTQTNHLALDDTEGRMQAQLASDHGGSSVSLGYITRIAGSEGRQDARGEGFELRTDQHGAIRAAQGLLVSTWGRRRGAGKVKEIGETIGQLTAARDVHEGAAREAQRHGALEMQGDQSDVTRAMKDANARLKGASAKGPDDFPEFEAPDIAVSSAENMHVAAKGCVHVASETHTAVTAGGHLSIASGKSLFASVREKIVLFAQKAITLVTPGPVRIQSIDGSMVLSAEDELSVSSARGIVRIAGKNGVDIACGGTLLRIRPEGITGYTDGKFLVHAANHATDKPQPQPVDNPVTADKPGRLAAHHVLVEEGGGFAIPNQPFRHTLDDGQVFDGVTSALGELPIVTSNATAFGVVELLSRSEPGNVIGVVRTTVYDEASKTTSSGTSPAAPKREERIGGQTVSTPNTASTSAERKPVYITCDPLNFGLRSYQFHRNSNHVDDNSYDDRRSDIEYPVAKLYTATIKSRLLSLSFSEVKEKSSMEIVKFVTPAVLAPTYKALNTGVFGLPTGTVASATGAMPSIVFVAPDDFKAWNMKPEYVACFNARKWTLAINLLSITSIAQSTDPSAKRGPMQRLANTIYHEARHCQQKFWMISLFETHPDDYIEFKNLDNYYRTCVNPIPLEIAKGTKFPDDALVRIGVHRMLVFDYYWAMVNAESPTTEFLTDFDAAQDAVCRLLNITPEVAKARALYTTGYRSHLHEEDAYACGDIVDCYWMDRDYFPGPGVCTEDYVKTIKQIGGV